MMRAASLPAVALPVAPAEAEAAGGGEDGVINGAGGAVGAGGESPESGGARGILKPTRRGSEGSTRSNESYTAKRRGSADTESSRRGSAESARSTASADWALEESDAGSEAGAEAGYEAATEAATAAAADAATNAAADAATKAVRVRPKHVRMSLTEPEAVRVPARQPSARRWSAPEEGETEAAQVQVRRSAPSFDRAETEAVVVQRQHSQGRMSAPTSTDEDAEAVMVLRQNSVSRMSAPV